VTARATTLDLAAIQAAITPRTRGILVNTPHTHRGDLPAGVAARPWLRLLGTLAAQRADDHLFSYEPKPHLLPTSSPSTARPPSRPSTSAVHLRQDAAHAGQPPAYVVMPPTCRTARSCGRSDHLPVDERYARPQRCAFCPRNPPKKNSSPAELEGRCLSTTSRLAAQDRDRMSRRCGRWLPGDQPQGPSTWCEVAWPDDQAFCDLAVGGLRVRAARRGAESSPAPSASRSRQRRDDRAAALPIFSRGAQRAAADHPGGVGAVHRPGMATRSGRPAAGCCWAAAS